MHPSLLLASSPPAGAGRTDGARIYVADLNPAELMVVAAIREALGASRRSRLTVAADGPDADELRNLRQAVERYVQHADPAPAAAYSTDAVLGTFEHRTLHALACLQAGLLGEAWKSLVPVCAAGEAGKPLVLLQEVAEVLQLRGRRIERWQFDPAFFRVAALI